MRNAVFLFALRRGNLVGSPALHLVRYDVVDGIGAPVLRIGCLATGHDAAAPLVGEEHLAAVIVERGGVPVGETVVDGIVDTLGRARIADVEQDAVA